MKEVTFKILLTVICKVDNEDLLGSLEEDVGFEISDALDKLELGTVDYVDFRDMEVNSEITFINWRYFDPNLLVGNQGLFFDSLEITRDDRSGRRSLYLTFAYDPDDTSRRVSVAEEDLPDFYQRNGIFDSDDQATIDTIEHTFKEVSEM